MNRFLKINKIRDLSRVFIIPIMIMSGVLILVLYLDMVKIQDKSVLLVDQAIPNIEKMQKGSVNLLQLKLNIDIMTSSVDKNHCTQAYIGAVKILDEASIFNRDNFAKLSHDLRLEVNRLWKLRNQLDEVRATVHNSLHYMDMLMYLIVSDQPYLFPEYEQTVASYLDLYQTSAYKRELADFHADNIAMLTERFSSKFDLVGFLNENPQEPQKFTDKADRINKLLNQALLQLNEHKDHFDLQSQKELYEFVNENNKHQPDDFSNRIEQYGNDFKDAQAAAIRDAQANTKNVESNDASEDNVKEDNSVGPYASSPYAGKKTYKDDVLYTSQLKSIMESSEGAIDGRIANSVNAAAKANAKKDATDMADTIASQGKVQEVSDTKTTSSIEQLATGMDEVGLTEEEASVIAQDRTLTNVKPTIREEVKHIRKIRNHNLKMLGYYEREFERFLPLWDIYLRLQESFVQDINSARMKVDALSEAYTVSGIKELHKDLREITSLASEIKPMMVGTLLFSVIGFWLIMFLIKRRIIEPLQTIAHLLIRFRYTKKIEIAAYSGFFKKDHLLEIREVIDVLPQIFDDYSAIKQNESHLKQRYEELVIHSKYDGLTKVFNRGSLNALVKEIGNSTPASFAILMVDIDFFKKLNDSMGHQCGDEVLFAVAQTLHSNLAKKDLVFRYGGEEFCIILSDVNTQNAYKIADRLCKRIASLKLINKGAESGLVTISVGLSTVTTSENQYRINDLIKQADKALYNAKNSGRNCVCIYNNVEGEVLEEATHNDISIEHADDKLFCAVNISGDNTDASSNDEVADASASSEQNTSAKAYASSSSASAAAALSSLVAANVNASSNSLNVGEDDEYNAGNLKADSQDSSTSSYLSDEEAATYLDETRKFLSDEEESKESQSDDITNVHSYGWLDGFEYFENQKRREKEQKESSDVHGDDDKVAQNDDDAIDDEQLVDAVLSIATGRPANDISKTRCQRSASVNAHSVEAESSDYNQAFEFDLPAEDTDTEEVTKSEPKKASESIEELSNIKQKIAESRPFDVMSEADSALADSDIQGPIATYTSFVDKSVENQVDEEASQEDSDVAPLQLISNMDDSNESDSSNIDELIARAEDDQESVYHSSLYAYGIDSSIADAPKERITQMKALLTEVSKVKGDITESDIITSEEDDDSHKPLADEADLEGNLKAKDDKPLETIEQLKEQIFKESDNGNEKNAKTVDALAPDAIVSPVIEKDGFAEVSVTSNKKDFAAVIVPTTEDKS